jgi:hypothetical protein
VTEQGDAEPPRWLNRTVVGVSITSAFGDVAYESTVTAEYLPSEKRGGALGTGNIGDLASLGLIWTAVSPVVGFGAAAFLMACGTPVLAGAPPPAVAGRDG